MTLLCKESMHLDSDIAVFPVLTDVVEVKTGSRSTAHWRIHSIRLNGWLRHSFAELITLLDIDGISQTSEDSNMTTSAGVSCEAFEIEIVCEMQPKRSEMRLRFGGRGGRRCASLCDPAAAPAPAVGYPPPSRRGFEHQWRPPWAPLCDTAVTPAPAVGSSPPSR